MIITAFNTLIFNPLYNGLIFLINTLPYADVGIAVITLTLLVKIVLFPLAHKVAYMQLRIRKITPELEEIKQKYKEDKQKQTLEIMGLYRRNNINPFLSILVIFIQIPIILGLYWVFFRGGLPQVDPNLLYSFVSVPTEINMNFLGLIDMGGRSMVLALLAGITQFVHSNYTLPKPKPRGKNASLKEDLAHSFHIQIKYLMPILIAGISYFISAAIALYLMTNNIFTIGQEILVRRQKHGKEDNDAQQHYESTA